MSAELEKLAQQFIDLGHKDVGQGIFARAKIARSRGLETFSATPVLPEGAIRPLHGLAIGGKTAKQLESALMSEEIGINDSARNMLRSRAFTISEPQTLNLVRIKVADLGLDRNPTTNQIYAKVNDLGLDLCPAEVGPQLCLLYKDQPIDEWFMVGMKQITGSDSIPCVFKLGRNSGGSWLFGLMAYPGRQWHPETEFVFSIRK